MPRSGTASSFVNSSSVGSFASNFQAGAPQPNQYAPVMIR